MQILSGHLIQERWMILDHVVSDLLDDAFVCVATCDESALASNEPIHRTSRLVVHRP
jgi:hypothetical protein